MRIFAISEIKNEEKSRRSIQSLMRPLDVKVTSVLRGLLLLTTCETVFLLPPNQLSDYTLPEETEQQRPISPGAQDVAHSVIEPVHSAVLLGCGTTADICMR